MKQRLRFMKALGIFVFSLVFSFSLNAQKAPKKMAIGYSLGIQKVDSAKMNYAKSVGMDCIEIGGFSGLVDRKTLAFKYTDQELMTMARKAKAAADAAGINIWSVHMGFSQFIDLSERNDARREKMLAFHKKILKMCAILSPQIVLFHPSWYLGLNERELRIQQLINSCAELNPLVRKIGAEMVIENMLGPELLRNEKFERPLCRTVAETKMIMDRLPKSIGSAIDMNHIKHPEALILAMGHRLKTVHIADGTGEQENHYLPCTHKGLNDWDKILSALYKVKYKGPFLFECHFDDEKQLSACYDELYNHYVKSF